MQISPVQTTAIKVYQEAIRVKRLSPKEPAVRQAQPHEKNELDRRGVHVDVYA